MTHAAAVTQPPVAPGEAIADRSRGADRQGRAEGDDGGFAGLLSKLAAGDWGQVRGEAAQTGQAPPATADRRKTPGWLNGNAEAFAEDVPLEMGEGAPLDVASGTQATGDAGPAIPVAAEPADPRAACDAAAAMVNDIAVATARVADGRAADAAGPQSRKAEGSAGPLPAQTLLELAELARDGRQRMAQDGARPAVADVTVLRRETHLAPVREAALADAGASLAAAAGSSDAGGGPQPGAQRATSIAGAAALRSGDAVDRGAVAQPLAPHLAVTTARNATETAMAGAGQQAANDAAVPGADAQGGIEPAAPMVRVDAPSEDGQATGIVQQLASRIASDAGTATSAPATTQRPDALAFVQRSPFLSPAKVLYIQLQPAELGTVTVRMSIRDQALQLDLEVGRGETADLIQRERETLSTLLRSAGYLVDGLDVRVADQASLGASAGGGQPGTQTPTGNQQGAPGGDARSPGARPHDERRGNSFGNQRNRDDEQASHAPRRGGIYV
jgi:chemotaxis protein MotD